MIHRVVMCLSLVLMTSLLPGCAQAVLLGYLIGGPPSIAPSFDTETGKSIVATGDKVIVICYADPQIKLKYPKIDTELATRCSMLMETQDITMEHPDYVRAWIDEHRDWETADEIAKEFDAKYVIEIELMDLTLYEENSAVLLRGNSQGYVNCYEITPSGSSEKIYSTEIDFTYPTRVARSTYDTTELTFKRDYLSRLSEVIGQHFYPRARGDRIGWAN